MTHTYLITLVTNEKKHLIEKVLEKNSKISLVHFANDLRHISITMNSFITLHELNNLVKVVDDFSLIKQVSIHPNFTEEDETTGVIVKEFGYFAFAIFVLIYALFLIEGKEIFALATLRIYFGTLLLIFGILKFKNYLDFAESHQRYDLISKHFCFYAYVYPFVEIFFGILLITNTINIFFFIILLFVMILRFIGILYSIAFGNGVEYAYLDSTFKMRISYATLIVDLLIASYAFYNIYTII